MTKPVVEVRPATRADLAGFYEKDAIGPSFKAIAGTVDGKVVAVAGLAFVRGRPVAFCDMKDEARRYKLLIHKTARRVIDDAKRRHRFIYAEADENEPSAARWLTALGFEQYEGSIFRWRKDD